MIKCLVIGERSVKNARESRSNVGNRLAKIESGYDIKIKKKRYLVKAVKLKNILKLR